MKTLEFLLKPRNLILLGALALLSAEKGFSKENLESKINPEPKIELSLNEKYLEYKLNNLSEEDKKEKSEIHNRLGDSYYGNVIGKHVKLLTDKDKEKHLKLAKEHYIKAIELNPERESSYIPLMNILVKTDKNYEKAIDYAKKLIEINPNSLEGYEALVGINYMLKNYEKTISYLKKLTKIDPEFNWKWLGGISQMYEEKGDIKQSIKYLKESIKVFPEGKSTKSWEKKLKALEKQ